jgi:excisionase family DNA binding protein
MIIKEFVMVHIHTGPVLPTEQEAKLAATARQVLARRDGEALQLQVKPTGQETVALDLPPVVTRLILDALKETAAGHAVALVPVEAEITTQQAADLLNVSRPFLIGLIDTGALPVRMVGNQRRIPLQDLLDYKADIYAKRREALRELVAYDQELGLE